MKYPLSYGKKERNVYLVGEGYFEVAKNVEKSFSSLCRWYARRVTGTTFNLRSYPEDSETEVALINGGVDVLANNKQVRLKPDEKAIYNRETGALYSGNDGVS